MPKPQETPQFERKRESADRSALRMAREEEELMQALGKMKERGQISDADISAHVESLAKRHDIERATGVPFESDEAFEEFERHAGSREGDFAPDLELPLDQGKVYRHQGKDYVYMGVNQEGKRILRREGDAAGTIEEYTLEEHEAHALENSSDESSDTEEGTLGNAKGDATREASGHPASAPPPPEIESVSAPADSEERVATQPEISEGAERLNALKGKIDAQYTILNETKGTKDANTSDKKRYDAAHRELRRLYKAAKDEAISLVGGEALATLIKTADTVLYQKGVDPKTRSKEEQDAYYDALRRREAFIELLKGVQVNREIASDLYRRALTHATDLDRLAKSLENGNVDAIKEGRARGALEWHDIPMRRPDQTTTLLGDILPIVQHYRTTPPHEDRPKKTPEEKKEKKRPVDRLLESLEGGQDLPDGVIHSFLKDKRTTALERERLTAALAARKAKRQAEREEKEREHADYVLGFVREGKGDTVPWDALEAHKAHPEVAAFITAHPELAPKTETRSTGRRWVKKTQGPQSAPLSGKALADAIEAGKPLGVVAEEPWEIARAGRRLAKPDIERASISHTDKSVPSADGSGDENDAVRMEGEMGPDGVSGSTLSESAETDSGVEEAIASFLVDAKSSASEAHPERNEDASIADRERGVFAVLDGMGGHAAGEVASTAARDIIHSALRELPRTATLPETKRALKEAIERASAALVEMGKNDAGLQGMGTTATVLKIHEGADGERTAVVGHVGDSRAYVLHADGTLEQVTRDDDIFSNMREPLSAEEEASFRNKLNNATETSALSEKERMLFGNRNRITQALGGESVDPRIVAVTLRAGDRLLLTSDGVHDNLTEGEIGSLLRTSDRNTAASSADRLVMAAQARSKETDADGNLVLRAKEDDMTAIVIDLAGADSSDIADTATETPTESEAGTSDVVPTPADRDTARMEGEMGPEGVSGVSGEVAAVPLMEAGGYKVGEVVTWRSPTGTDYPDLTITGFSPDGAYVFTDVSGTGLPISEIFRAAPKSVSEHEQGADERSALSQEELREMIEQYEAKVGRTPDDDNELARLKEIYRSAGGVLPQDAPPVSPPEEENVVPVPARERAASPESTRKIFDPERELGAILGLPKEERRQRLDEYKVKLAWQRKGLARTQAMVVEAIRKNPDMTEQEFDALFGKEAEKFEVSNEQCIRALTIFGNYKKKHEAVEKYSAQYPDPEDLFREVFGFDPSGPVEVVKGPMTLCFRLKNEDFVNIYGGKRHNGQVVSPKLRKDAKLAGGFALNGSLIPELAGTLLVEKAGLINKVLGNPEAVRAHEEQHAINTLFQEDLRVYRNRMQVADAWKRIDVAATPEELRDGICKLLRMYRGEMEDKDRASDEIFAYLREGRPSNEILRILMKSPLYDYFRGERKRTKEAVQSFRGDRFTKEEERIYDEAADQVFIEEYRERITQGLTAYLGLRQMGFTEEGVRGVLLHEPLTRWGKVVERIQDPGSALPESVAQGFKERFGIDQQELLNIEAFRKLSEGQQLLVLRNLEQVTLRDVKKEARALQKEEWGKTSAPKKILKQLYSFGMNPEHRVAELEKEMLEKVRQGEFVSDEAGAKALAERMADIEALSKVAVAGPEVNINEDGELECAYISGKDLFDSNEDSRITPEDRRTFEDFNQAASAFAALPHEWGYDTAGLSRRDRRRYTEARDAYERARGTLSQLYRRRFAEEGAKDATALAMRAMNAVDERVQLDQLFNNHPDAEQALGEIEDQSTIAAAAKEFWKAKGAFVAYGAAARAATVALVGTMPVVGAVLAYAGGAGVAGMVGKKIGEGEAKRLFKEKQADGRMSEEDLREEVSYEVYKTEPTTTDGKPDGGKKRVFDAEGDPVVERVEKRRIKEYTDATFFVDRIERLTEKLNETTDVAARELLGKKIAQTVALMHEKFEAGLVNFGGSSLEENDERKGNVIANKLSFIQAMALGRAFVVVDNDNLEMEFSRMIKLHEAKIDDVRKKEIAKAGKKAALWRAGFALAGAAIADSGLLDGVRRMMNFGDVGNTSVASQSSGSTATPLQQVGKHGELTPSPEHPSVSTQGSAGVPPNIALNKEIVPLEEAGGGAKDGTSLKDWMEPGPNAASEGTSLNDWKEPDLPKAAPEHYRVRSGDTVTKILKTNIPELAQLSPRAQENAIQNLLKSLSPEEMRAIGLGADPDKIMPDQTLDLKRVGELLHEKKVGGIDLIERAQQLNAPIVETPQFAPEGLNASIPQTGGADDAEKLLHTKEGDALLRTPEGRHLWNELSETNKERYAAEATPRHIEEDIGKLFAKGPLETWPKEWLALRSRNAVEVLAQTEQAESELLPRGKVHALGDEWFVVEKIQKQIRMYGLTKENGFVPTEHETLEAFLLRALKERILRDGPIPWVN